MLIANTLIKTLDDMIKVFSEKLFEHNQNGDLYGGVEISYGKKEVMTLMTGTYLLFEMDDDYRKGKKHGLTVLYERDNYNNVVQVHVHEVYYGGDKSPLQIKKEIICFGANVLQFMLETKKTISSLTQFLKAYFTSNEVKKDIECKADSMKDSPSFIKKTNSLVSTQLTFDF